MRYARSRKILKKTFMCILVIFTSCEYLIYHIVISQCDWPTFNHGTIQQQYEYTFRNGKFIDDKQTIRVIILSDPHLLGSKHGHWFDKLRREWQMKQSFQTAMTYLSPDVVIILGDIFDEGMICSDEEWKYYVRRFWDIFSHDPSNVHFHIVPGNHDIGFHERWRYNSKLEKRFRQDFNVSGVNILHLQGNTFVLLNSMAFQQDGCSLCEEAEKDLHDFAKKLKCLHKDQFLSRNYWKEKCDIDPPMSDPIIFQHFPLYRSSEVNCTGKDAPPFPKRSRPNRGGWEVLSESASELLLSSTQPRLIFSGHTHHGCHIVHNHNIHEFTVPSFSWRNRNDPSFYLAQINPNAVSLQKCFIPEENTVILMYICLGLSCLLYITWTSVPHYRCSDLHRIALFQRRQGVKVC